MDFDDFLETKLRPCGRYQRFVIFLLTVPWLFSSFNTMGIAFIASTPSHHCAIPNMTPNDANYSVTNTTKALIDLYIPRRQDGSLDQCKRYVLNASALTVNTTHVVNGSHARPTEACAAYVYDTSQYRSTVVTQYNLVCAQKYKTAMFYTSYVIGMIISSFLYSYLIDVFGRKPMYVISCIGVVSSTLGTAFVDNFYVYCIMRAFIALFTMGSTNTAYVLGLELVGRDYRAAVGTIFMMGWAAGYMFLPALAYVINDHVHLQIAMAALESLTLLTIWFVPESPRWLISKGREQKAIAVCRVIARWNKANVGSSYTLTVEKKQDERGTPVDLFRTRFMRRNTCVLFFGWTSVTFVYYGISWNTSSLGGDAYLNFFLSAVVEVPAYILNFYALNKFGRRWSTSLSMFISGALLFVAMPLPADVFLARVVLSMLTKFLITAAFAMIYQYTTELYPTAVRALGFGWCSTMSRLGSMIAGNILLLAEVHPALPTALLAAFPVVSGILFLLTPETKGRSLPQTVEDVEKAGVEANGMR